MDNHELAEIEQKSWNKNENIKVITKAKKIIMHEMIKKGKSNIAEEYLKKCLITFSSNFELLGSLLTAYAKLIKKSYQGTPGTVKIALTFILEQVKKASV